MNLLAGWWKKEESEKDMVVCNLCIHKCHIPHGRAGYCQVRHNVHGVLLSPFLGKFSSVAIDPIEKKPLYNWKPGTFIFSLGSIGCTMRRPFCQNHSIAQPASLNIVNLPVLKEISAKQLIHTIKKMGLASVAFTYNEPTLQAEYIIQAGPFLRQEKISVVLVTNGNMSPQALQDLMPWIDALNIDLKTYNTSHYKKMGGSLEQVKDNIKYLVQAGKHVELTTLVVPKISDDEGECLEMIKWVASVSPDILT